MKTSVLALVAVVSLFTATATLGDDHGNSPATATPISLGSVLAGALDPAGDEDFFSITLPPLAWYGFALFSENSWTMQLDVEDDIGQMWGSGAYEVAFVDNPFDDVPETRYPVVRHTDGYEGAGGEEYRLTAFAFPTSFSPLDALRPITLSTSQPVDAQTFSFGPSTVGQDYAVIVAPADEDRFFDVEVVFQEYHPTESGWWATFGQAGWYDGPALVRFDEPGLLRAATRIRVWEDLSEGGDSVALKIQPFSPQPLVSGVSTGQLVSPLQVDGWIMSVQPETLYGLWMTGSDGRVIQYGEYRFNVFSESAGYWNRQESSWAMLSFQTWEEDWYDSYVCSLTAGAFPDEEPYTLHLQSYADDYGRWEFDTPPAGTAVVNVAQSGVIEVPPDRDGFFFEASAGYTYALYSPQEEQMSLWMYGDWTWPGWYSGTVFTAPDNGTGEVSVEYGWGYEANTGAYQFLVSEFLDDPDNSMDEAVPITVDGPSVVNDLKAPGDIDWFVFSVVEGNEYTFRAGETGVVLQVYYDNDWPWHSSDGGSLTFTAEQSGTCYATIRSRPAFGVYTASVTSASGVPDGYAEWAAGYDLGDLAGPNDDADGDGFTNNEERIAGTNPTLRGDLFRASGGTRTAGGTGLILGDALPGRVYTARYTTDLRLAWNLWTEVATSIAGGKIVAPLNPALEGAVYRLIVALE